MSVVLSLWRWHRSPGRYANDLGFVFSVEARFYRPDGGLATRLSFTPAIGDIHGVRLEGTTSRRQAPGGNHIQEASAWGEPHPLFALGGWWRTRSIRLRAEENHIQDALREGREPHPALMREENQNHLYALNRRKAALFSRRQHGLVERAEFESRIKRAKDRLAKLEAEVKAETEKETKERDPTDVAFIAMAHYQLGHTEQARTQLARLHALMQEPEHAGSEEAQAFLREAEELIEGGQSPPESQLTKQEPQP